MCRRREGREYAKKLMMIILFSKPNREGKPVIEITEERRGGFGSQANVTISTKENWDRKPTYLSF